MLNQIIIEIMRKHINITVFGQVQGVGFRWYCFRTSVKLGLTGWVKNQPDDTVYIEAEGESDKLEKLVEWCKEGSPLSRVVKVEVSDGGIKDYKEFIRY
jgi:acylphosphatase